VRYFSNYIITMNRMLLIFLGLLFGLVLCCYLGNWNSYEGMENGTTNTYYGPNGTTAAVNTYANTIVVTNKDGTTSTYTSSSDNPTTFLGPDGTRADYAIDSTNVKITGTDGKIITFSPRTEIEPSKDNADPSNHEVNITLDLSGTKYFNPNNPNNGNMNTLATAAHANTNYDNYDHYSGTSYPNMFYGPNGITARIIKTSTTDSIVVTQSNGASETYYINGSNPESNIYYGQNDTSIKIVKETDGKTALKVTKSDGSTIIYAQYDKYGNYDTVNDPGVNDPGLNQGGPYDLVYYPNGLGINDPGKNEPGRNDPGRNDPGKNEPGRNDPGRNDPGLNEPGRNVLGRNDPGLNEPGLNDPGINDPGLNQPGRDYYSSLPPGVPRSQIPPGEEDLYILKSQVVPPVCPKCPSPICPAMDESKCPACPPCARCPEPQFECKKTFTAAAFNPQYAPVPVLSNFSTFGM